MIIPLLVTMAFLAVRCVLPFAGETSSKHTLFVSNLVVHTTVQPNIYICTTTNLDHGAPLGGSNSHKYNVL
jgi:hypothetical protein